jgi:cell division protein FtsB
MRHYFADIWDTIRSGPRKYILQALLVLFVIWFVFGDFGLVTRLRMEREHRTLMERQELEQKRIAGDQEKIKNAYHPDSIEKVAREKYNFRREGESVFIIRQP